MPPPSESKTPHLTLFVTFHIHPPLLESWFTAHRPIWTTLATEPKCIYFDVFHNPSVPGQMRLVEVWTATREWFETEQLTKPYYETLWAASRPTWEKEVEIEYWERVGEGMSWKGEFLRGGVEGTEVDE